MNFLPAEIERYVDSHTEKEPTLLQELSRETNLNVLMPRMLSGNLQGRTLSFISKLLRPNFILEIGTYTGYSALCLAEGLTQSGELHTIDNNEELHEMAVRYFIRSEYASKIVKHTGNALDLIPSINRLWDLVFIDADKQNYLNYYKMVIDKVRPGGVIMADNVLWSGKVTTTYIPDNDKDTIALMNFNKFIADDSRIEKLLLPVRDGIYCAIKK